MRLQKIQRGIIKDEKNTNSADAVAEVKRLNKSNLCDVAIMSSLSTSFSSIMSSAESPSSASKSSSTSSSSIATESSSISSESSSSSESATISSRTSKSSTTTESTTTSKSSSTTAASSTTTTVISSLISSFVTRCRRGSIFISHFSSSSPPYISWAVTSILSSTPASSTSP